MSHLNTAVFMIAVSGCASTVPPRASETHGAGPEIIVHVLEGGAIPEVALPGVEVTAVTEAGASISYGKTVGGNVRLSKSKLSQDKAVVVLFCHPLFQCGARRLVEDHLLAYDEMWVDLQPVVAR